MSNAQKRLLPLLLALLFLFGSALTAAAAGTDAPSDPTDGQENTDSGDGTPPDEERGWVEELLGIGEKIDVLQAAVNAIRSSVDPRYVFTLAIHRINEQNLKLLEKTIPAIGERICTVFLGSAFVGSMMRFFRWLALILLFCGSIVRLLRMLEAIRHGEAAGMGDLLFDLLKGYGLVLFCLPVVEWMNTLFGTCTAQVLDAAVSVETTGSLLGTLSASDGKIWGTSLLLFGLVVVTVIMLFRVMKRACTVFLQVVVGYLYAYDLVKGNDVLTEWCRDVLAGYITFAFQLLFYHAGLQLLTNGLRGSGSLLGADTLVGITLLVGVSVIPAALRKFGQTPPPGSFARGLGQAVNIGMGIARLAM